MIPIRDQIKTRRVPFINYLLITVNIIVFIFEWLSGASTNSVLLSKLAFTPAVFLAAPANLGNIGTIFTSMFLHAGFLHLAGNMLYLWIFGDNVEDRMGHIPYLLFYLAGGVFAALLSSTPPPPCRPLEPVAPLPQSWVPIWSSIPAVGSRPLSQLATL